MSTTTFHDYDLNGSTTTFAFTFPTFKEEEVVVEVDNVIKTTSSHYNITSYSTANGGNDGKIMLPDPCATWLIMLDLAASNL